MTKDEWKYLQGQVEIPIYVWYEFYKEKGGKLTSMNEFEQIFTQIIFSDSYINGKRTNYVTALNQLFKYYNNKFA